jgi:hypothetical protein
MHELGHAHYGHVGVSGKQVLLANRWAAHRMFDFEDMLAAAELEQSNPAAAASKNR